MDAIEIAALLSEYGLRTALQGQNSFYRAKAYGTAAGQIAATGDQLPALIERGELTRLPGIGQAIAGLVERLASTGTDPKLEAMRREIPASVLERMNVPGLRPE
jgi:DNA polymerase (family X)